MSIGIRQLKHFLLRIAHLSKSSLRIFFVLGGSGISDERRSSQLSISGFQPRSEADTKMIPARLTVAGDALFKFSTSKTILKANQSQF